MKSGQSAFRYGLQGLLRQRAAALDALKADLATAAAHTLARARDLEAHTAHVRQIEEYQRSLHTAGAHIDISARLRVYETLRGERAQSTQLASMLAEARKKETELTDALRAARQALKVVERHRERTLLGHQVEQQRRDLRVADDIFLSVRRSRAAGLPEIDSET